MVERFPLSLGVVAAIVVALFTVAFSGRAVAQVQCQSGEFTAPTGDSFFGITPGSCVNSTLQQQLQGGCNFNPYQVLQQYSSGSSVALTPQVGGVGSSQLQNGINPVLACRLAQFLQYAQTKGYTLKIVSGYRSAQTQANTCLSICGNANGCSASQGGNCAVPGGSCHQYGLAVDLGNGSSGSLNWAQKFLGLGHPASGAQQFKIFFPLTTDGGHLQCIEDPVAACSASSNPCGGTATITPNLAYTGTGQQLGLGPSVSSAIQNPLLTSAIQSGIIAASSPFPASPLAAAPLAQPVEPAQTCTPQYYCSANTLYYESSSCATQVSQVCQYGCSGTTCTPAPSSQSSSNTLTSSSASSNSQPLSSTPLNTNTSPVVSPTPVTSATLGPIGTSSPLSLASSLSQSVQGSDGLPIASTNTIVTIASGTVAQPAPAVGQSTFPPSSDSGAVYQSSPPLSQVLDSLKSVLNDILSYIHSL